MEVYRSGHYICARRAYAHFNTLTTINMEVYRSGHNGPHSKCGNGVTRSWVRIPPLPPTPKPY